MPVLRNLVLLSESVALGLAFGVQSPTLAATHATKKIKAPVSVLLVLSAQQGTIAKTKDGYTLTLRGVDKKTLWFADQPDRRAGFVNTSHLIVNWLKSFKSSQPNAGLVHVGLRLRDEQGNPRPESLELMHPSMHANGNLVFAVRMLSGDRIDTGHFLQPVLFIDSSGFGALADNCYGTIEQVISGIRSSAC